MIETLRPGARARRRSSTSHHDDIAASLQAMLEEVYLHVLRTLWERTRLAEPVPRGRRAR